jgi:hypothetical protein
MEVYPMPLTFPTLAEQVIQEFEAPGKAVSLTKLAREKAWAEEVIDFGRHRIFMFEDDTTLHVRGRGRAHKYWSELP